MELPEVFINLLTVLIAFIVTQGIKGLLEVAKIDLSGYSAAITALLVGTIIFFLEGVLGIFPPETQESVLMIMQAIASILGAFGVHKTYRGLKPGG